MNEQPVSKTIVLKPADAQIKITDVVEAIISSIMETGEVNVLGINDSMFLACSAINMATQIAKVYVDDIDIAPVQMPTLGKVSVISVHLSQQAGDYSKWAEQEEKKLVDVAEQTISVSRVSSIERLVTITLMRLTKFDEVKVVAAGGSINDAIVLALKLTGGQISKDPLGIKLFYLHSIIMRNDPTKSIAALSIFLQKGVSSRYTKRQNEVFKKLETGT
jgi:hypothetical protein